MYKITIHIHGNLIFFSYVWLGLDRLRKKGLVTLDYVFPWQKSYIDIDNDFIYFLQIAKNDDHRIICLDLTDLSDFYATEALQRADFYFKRSYYSESMPPNLPMEKIKPWGISFSFKFNSFASLMVMNLACSYQNIKACINNKDDFKKCFKKIITPFHYHFRMGRLGALEDCNGQGEKYILFQTRAWSKETCAEWEQINESRVRIIEALRKEFKENFVGGFIPDAFSRKYFKTYLSVHKTDPKNYYDLIKRAKVCVYTRGLYHSTAFKLGEYLAARKCIVAEPIRNTLAGELIAGKHYLLFRTPEECIAACHRLLADEELARAMKKNNRQYYVEWVEPAAHLLKIFHSIFE